jgi:DNA-directed RNA polymerase subunit RPC12/RpoP
MPICKSKTCGEEFDVEFYQGQPDKEVECHHCGAKHLLTWYERVPGAALVFKSRLLEAE